MILNIKSMVSQTGCLMPVIMLKRSTKQLARGSSVSHWKRKQNSWLALAAQADMEPLAKLRRGGPSALQTSQMSWVSGCEMPYVGPCDRHTHMYGVIWCQARCPGASGGVTETQTQSWRQAPSCSAGLAPGAITFWGWQRVACCLRHHEAAGSLWLCIKNTAEKGWRWGAGSPGSDHYGPRVCRKGTHCCQRLLSPHLCPQPGSRRQRAVQDRQWAEISLGRAGRKGLSLFLCIYTPLYPGCVLGQNTRAAIPFSTQQEIATHQTWHAEIRPFQAFQPVPAGVRPQPRAGFHAVCADPSVSSFPGFITSNVKNLRLS